MSAIMACRRAWDERRCQPFVSSQNALIQRSENSPKGNASHAGLSVAPSQIPARCKSCATTRVPEPPVAPTMTGPGGRQKGSSSLQLVIAYRSCPRRSAKKKVVPFRVRKVENSVMSYDFEEFDRGKCYVFRAKRSSISMPSSLQFFG